MMSNGKELVYKLMDLILEMEKHCEEFTNTRTYEKCKCPDCALSRYFNYVNSGCILQEIKDKDLLSDICYTMKFHNSHYETYQDYFTENM